jgi:phage terminase small subunit
MATLNPKQWRFVQEYLIDLNGAAAYRRAGYKVSSAESARAAASRLLRKVNVAAAVAAAMQARAERTQITQDRVVQELATIAFSSYFNYEVGDNGEVMVAEGGPPEAARALAAVTHKRKEVTVGPGRTPVILMSETSVRLWDKRSALHLLGKHLGLWREQPEAENPQDACYRALLAQLKDGRGG